MARGVRALTTSPVWRADERRGALRSGRLARMQRIVCATVLVLCAACVPFAVGCGGEAESDDPFIRMLQRANKADDNLGARLVVRGTLKSGGQSIRIRGYGQVEADLMRDRFVFASGGVREETFDDEPFTFVAVDEALARLAPKEVPDGTKWLKVDKDVVAKAAGQQGLRELENLTPGETLELLPKLDPKVRAAGREAVRGVATKRFRITVSFAKLVEVLSDRAGASLGCALSTLRGSLQLVLWIDRDDLIRRVRIRVQAGRTSFVITSTVTAFDRDLRVDVPSGETVFDATDVTAKAARKDRDKGDDVGCGGGDATRI